MYNTNKIKELINTLEQDVRYEKNKDTVLALKEIINDPLRLIIERQVRLSFMEIAQREGTAEEIDAVVKKIDENIKNIYDTDLIEKIVKDTVNKKEPFLQHIVEQYFACLDLPVVLLNSVFAITYVKYGHPIVCEKIFLKGSLTKPEAIKKISDYLMKGSDPEKPVFILDIYYCGRDKSKPILKPSQIAGYVRELYLKTLIHENEEIVEYNVFDPITFTHKRILLIKEKGANYEYLHIGKYIADTENRIINEYGEEYIDALTVVEYDPANTIKKTEKHDCQGCPDYPCDKLLGTK